MIRLELLHTGYITHTFSLVGEGSTLVGCEENLGSDFLVLLDLLFPIKNSMNGWINISYKRCETIFVSLQSTSSILSGETFIETSPSTIRREQLEPAL